MNGIMTAFKEKFIRAHNERMAKYKPYENLEMICPFCEYNYIDRRSIYDVQRECPNPKCTEQYIFETTGDFKCIITWRTYPPVSKLIRRRKISRLENWK